ncbi:GntR family transcriptional regulator [Azospirillum canadense]|uniref:GntR family transcriptional regulator n=1 Tax=Azospirillum canadense TaxID=403962 RepID=UPI002226EFE3|nr:GntR family transcriptional regulator [Azospirillum canadense]MCW2238825.1 DNA-binding GntR family transcriptional regulator [Azospirillum canadense]
MYDSDNTARRWELDPDTAEDDGESWRLPEQRSLPDIVAERIIQAIRSGELKPGDRIVEVALAKRLGVSRAPLREALKTLGARGLVESWRNRGTFVTSLTNESAVQVIMMRANLEGFAARIVASTLTDAMLADLEARTREMERVGKSGDAMAYRNLDWGFHERLCILAGNEYLLGAWRSISSLVWLFLLSHPDHERAVPRVINNHELMLAALASRDPDVAERTFRGVILRSGFRRYGMDIPPAFTAIVGGLPDGSAPL